jgi:GNAT superfamily N-acetyltransferase
MFSVSGIKGFASGHAYRTMEVDGMDEVVLYSQQDRKECANLFHKVFTAQPFEYDWLKAENIERYFFDMERTPHFLSFVLRQKTKMVAACLGHASDYFLITDYKINEFFVDPAYQRHGLGAALLKGVEKALKERGFDGISLFTQAGMPSFDFYQKNGFILSESTAHMMKPLIK